LHGHRLLKRDALFSMLNFSHATPNANRGGSWGRWVMGSLGRWEGWYPVLVSLAFRSITLPNGWSSKNPETLPMTQRPNYPITQVCYNDDGIQFGDGPMRKSATSAPR
jgi:hypothetical protein